MTPFPFSEVLSPLLWSGTLFLLWLAAGLVFYGVLFDRAVFEGRGRVQSACFGAVDGAFAGALCLLFAAVATAIFVAQVHAAGPGKVSSSSDMVVALLFNTVFFGCLMAGVIGGLLWRKLPWSEALGLGLRPAFGVVGRAAVAIGLAYPLIAAAIVATQVLLALNGRSGEPQDIVRFLAQPGASTARLVVAFSAVLFAPIQEEFIFRGYLYGVLRRYAGVPVGLLVNAALFAGIHGHAPSFGGLFVLAACLTLAYEWTGSLYVPMLMHALFNSLTVVSLFRGGADL